MKSDRPVNSVLHWTVGIVVCSMFLWGAYKSGEATNPASQARDVVAPAAANTPGRRGDYVTSGAGTVWIYRSVDAAQACLDELRVTEHAGLVCHGAVAAVLDNGTRVSRLEELGWLGFYKRVTVLEGRFAGVTGVVASNDYHFVP